MNMRVRGAAVMVGVAVVLAGCGGGAKSNGEASKTPAQVLHDTLAVTDVASAVHVSGKVSSDGTPITIDIHIVRGEGGRGSMSENGLRFDLVRSGKTVYIRGSDAFYKKFTGPSGAQLFHGRWLAFPASSADMGSITPFTDIDTFFHGITSQHGKLANDGETTFRGQKAVAIRDTTQGGTLYVAATGKPYPLGISGTGSNAGTISFTEWNARASVTAPKNAVDVGKLKG